MADEQLQQRAGTEWRQYARDQLGADRPYRSKGTAAGVPGDVSVLGLIRDSEGFRTGTYWDVNAHRLGYGSDTITGGVQDVMGHKVLLHVVYRGGRCKT